MITPLYGGDAPGTPYGDRQTGAAPAGLAGDPAADGTEAAPQRPPPGEAPVPVSEETTDSKPDDRAKKVLLQAAQDTRLLVSYLSRRDYKKLQALQIDFTVADRLIAGDYSRDLEVALWAQLGVLSDAARPASAESIADSRYYVTIAGEENEQQSKAGRKLRTIRQMASLALAVTFLLGVYVSITSTAVSLTRADIAERKQIILGNYKGTRAETIVGAAQNGPPSSANTNEKQPPNDEELPPPNDQQALGPQVADPVMEQPAVPVKDLQVGVSDQTQKEETESDTGAGGGESAQTDADRQWALINIAHDELEGEISAGYALLLPTMLGGPRITGTYASGDEEYDLFNVVLLDLQENLNRIIENYLIPMLGAFLGVAVYIIRDTNERLESVALSPMDADGYWPRILLGLVAGLTIGWIAPTSTASTAGVVTPDALGVLQNLSKTAIAFVVGYSIEVLFNILDAIKVALGVREDKPENRD